MLNGTVMLDLEASSLDQIVGTFRHSDTSRG